MNEPGPTRIAHLSDIHFGRIAYPEIVQHLIGEINERNVQLVAISGDLTQRARRWQFRAAAAMLRAFRAPVIVVPGNHDVYPWWRPLSRVMLPLQRYKRFISGDLHPSFTSADLAVLGINSAHGRTIKGGRIGRRERHLVRSFFSSVDRELFKVLVVHHHLASIQSLAPHDIARKAQLTLEVASDAGVDLILCGHLHVSHVEPLETVPGAHRLVIASAGTATSNRGRHSNRHTNFYNVIEVTPESFLIEERRYDPDRRGFVENGQERFARLPDVSRSRPG